MATLVGTNFNDYLTATNAGDYVYGLAGNDTLVGGMGADTQYGGAGADYFKYNSAGETSGDRIMDYKWWEGDKIDLHNIDAKESVWWNPSTWGNQDFSWKGDITGKALYAGEVGYVHSGGNTYVYGNTDGDGTYEVAITVAGNVPFIKSDFVL